LLLDTKTTASNALSPVSSTDGVIPAKAGIQAISAKKLDARLRGHDDAAVSRRGITFKIFSNSG
jgi:hypothetical protein